MNYKIKPILIKELTYTISLMGIRMKRFEKLLIDSGKIDSKQH